MKRSTKRLALVRSLPCVKCGNPDSVAAHSNFAEHGKGMGTKSFDAYTIPLCTPCHAWLDQYHELSRIESKTWFKRMLDKTNKMLSFDESDIY